MPCALSLPGRSNLVWMRYLRAPLYFRPRNHRVLQGLGIISPTTRPSPIAPSLPIVVFLPFFLVPFLLSDFISASSVMNRVSLIFLSLPWEPRLRLIAHEFTIFLLLLLHLPLVSPLSFISSRRTTFFALNGPHVLSIFSQIIGHYWFVFHHLLYVFRCHLCPWYYPYRLLLTKSHRIQVPLVSVSLPRQPAKQASNSIPKRKVRYTETGYKYTRTMRTRSQQPESKQGAKGATESTNMYR